METIVICKKDQCKKETFSGGFCQIHYKHNLKKNKKTIATGSTKIRSKECAVFGCSKDFETDGLCRWHNDLQKNKLNQTENTVETFEFDEEILLVSPTRTCKGKGCKDSLLPTKYFYCHRCVPRTSVICDFIYS